MAASELIAGGEFGKMVCLRAGEITSVLIEDAVARLKLVDLGSEIVRTARSVGISFGDEQ